MIKNYKKILGFVSAFTILVVSAIGIGAVQTAFANPSYVAPTVQTNTATSSPAYMTPGNATSTLTYDAYANPTGNKFVPSKISLGMQFAASNTSATLGINIEYSNDGIDWYRDFTTDPNSRGTTTAQLGFTNPNTMSWAFASSTVGGGKLSSSQATSTAMIIVPTPTRFVRAIFSITGSNGAIWAQIAPIKELY